MHGGKDFALRILRLSLASLAAGALAGVVLLAVPLAPAGLDFIPAAALIGAMVGGPWALLCGGLVRAAIRRWQRYGKITAIFAAAGLAAGALLLFLLMGGFDPEETTPAMMAQASLAGLAGALVYRFLMPPIRLPLPEEP